MGFSPPFSSQTGASSVEAVGSPPPVTSLLETQTSPDDSIDSTPITESRNVVTKTEEAVADIWATEPKAPVSEREFLTVTLKAGTGYDAPWLVAHANSVEEALEFLKHPDLDELMDLTARQGKALGKAFGGSQSFAKPAAGGSGGGWSKPAPQAAASSETPQDTCPTHNCPMEYVAPFKKRDGSEISARVACPVPNCRKKTYWLNKDGSWTLKEQ